ncbi:hypothetical protein KKC91_03780 [bacterium]|nr:hypothetical protein [bacterium]
MIEKEDAKGKAEEIKDILVPLLKRKFHQEAKVKERSMGWNRKYYKVTWNTLGRQTFAAVDMDGYLTINKDRKHLVYDCHIRKLKENGFTIKQTTHGAVDNSYVDWNIPNLEKFVKLRFECYT